MRCSAEVHEATPYFVARIALLVHPRYYGIYQVREMGATYKVWLAHGTTGTITCCITNPSLI